MASGLLLVVAGCTCGCVWWWQAVLVYSGGVRLNLFNHVLALFCAKFACNLAIRYNVFRLESYKGFV